MAARQLWVFLSAQDASWLLARIDAREPGLVASEGRYLHGAARDLLENPARLERREALPAERRLYLLHPKHSQEVVAHEQPAGPFAGWSQIDEERTDCLVLRIPAAPSGELEPSRLYAHTSFWRAGDKLRKRPPFSLWANQTLRWLLGELPATSVRFMRAGPDARAGALAGRLRLTYLYRTIAPTSSGAAGPLGAQPLPAGAVTEESPDDAD